MLSQLPTSLSDVTAEAAAHLTHLISGIKQLHVSGHLSSTDSCRVLANDLLQFVYQVHFRHVTNSVTDHTQSVTAAGS